MGIGDGASDRGGAEGVAGVLMLVFLLCFLAGVGFTLSGCLLRGLEELDLRLSFVLLPVLAQLGVRFTVVLLGWPNAASRVSAKLSTPNVLSRNPPAGSVLCELSMARSISSSLLMKKAVGAWFEGMP